MSFFGGSVFSVKGHCLRHRNSEIFMFIKKKTQLGGDPKSIFPVLMCPAATSIARTTSTMKFWLHRDPGGQENLAGIRLVSLTSGCYYQYQLGQAL